MNRSFGDGFPWDAACFQLESSPLARDVSQAVGPEREREREKLLTDWPWVSGERGEPSQTRHQGRWRCPAHTAGTSEEKQAMLQGQRPKEEGWCIILEM